VVGWNNEKGKDGPFHFRRDTGEPKKIARFPIRTGVTPLTPGGLPSELPVRGAYNKFSRNGHKKKSTNPSPQKRGVKV